MFKRSIWRVETIWVTFAQEEPMNHSTTQRNCCVLGRAMNLHNLPAYDPSQIEERPFVQLGLFVLSAAGFLLFFVV